MQLLEQTYLIYQATPFTKNIDKEISQQKKLYFADTGILNVIAGNQLSSGQIFENAIATQLKPLGPLQYYQRKTGQEIDFIFKGDTALEVKETPLEQDINSLRQRATTIEIDKYLLIGPSPSFEWQLSWIRMKISHSDINKIDDYSTSLHRDCSETPICWRDDKRIPLVTKFPAIFG